MGSRSQIYVVYETKERNSDTVDLNLAARYFQINSGAEMVARAAMLLQRLESAVNSYDELSEDFKKSISEASWKSSSVSRTINELPYIINSVIYTNENNLPYVYEVYPSMDIVQESLEYDKDNVQIATFFNQDNNDGKFIVYVPLEGKIEYAFTNEEFKKPMSAAEYMEWDDQIRNVQDKNDIYTINYDRNQDYIDYSVINMSKERLVELLSANYKNMPPKAPTLDSFSCMFNVGGETKFVAIEKDNYFSHKARVAVYDIQDNLLTGVMADKINLPRGDFQLYTERDLAWAVANEPKMNIIPQDARYYVSVNMTMLEPKFDYQYFIDHEGYEFSANEVIKNQEGQENDENDEYDFDK